MRRKGEKLRSKLKLNNKGNKNLLLKHLHQLQQGADSKKLAVSRGSSKQEERRDHKL